MLNDKESKETRIVNSTDAKDRSEPVAEPKSLRQKFAVWLKKSVTKLRVNKKDYLKNKKIVAISLALLVIILLVGFMTLQIKHNRDWAAERALKSKESSLEKFEQLETSSDDLVMGSNSQQAVDDWKSYASNPPAPELKSRALLNYANSLQNTKQYEKAREQYYELEDIQDDYMQAAVLGIATTSEKLGDYTKAIEYYQKLIKMETEFQEQLPEDDQGRIQSSQNVQAYEFKINFLKGQQ